MAKLVENGQASGPDRIRELVIRKKKATMKKPKIIVCVSNDQEEAASSSSRPQFFVQDLQRVLLHSTIGQHFKFYPRWCRMLRQQYMKSVNLITVNNLAEYDYIKLAGKFEKFNQIFRVNASSLNSVDFISASANKNTFFNEFINVPIPKTQWVKIRDDDEFRQKTKEAVREYSKLYFKAKSLKSKQNKEEEVVDSPTTSHLDRIPRTSLLLSVKQMLREDYPLPFDQSTVSTSDYVFTKDEYEPVDDSSPLYSIDCEMCCNVDGEMETVWLAIVNERLECLYETFVKPQKKVINYLTKITGIDQNMLKDVKVDLKQVQQKLREILPPNAILCGQSLNNDLHSLKMFHPYVIDTSVIFNVSGSRDAKPSLKILSAQFLGKLIQEGTHNPVIDAKASLQLVLLKLRNGIDFGDVIINGCTNMFSEENRNTINFEHMDLSDPKAIARFIYHTGINITQEFFYALTNANVSGVYIENQLRRNKYFSSYYGIQHSLEADNEQAFEKLQASLNKHKFTWTEFYVGGRDNSPLDVDKSETKKVLKYIRKAYEQLDEDSMLMVVFTGRCELNSLLNEDNTDHVVSRSELLKGRCFVKIKADSLDEMDAEIRQLKESLNGHVGKNDMDNLKDEMDCE